MSSSFPTHLSANTSNPITGQQHMAFIDSMYELLDDRPMDRLDINFNNTIIPNVTPITGQQHMAFLDSYLNSTTYQEIPNHVFTHPPSPSMISIINSIADEYTSNTSSDSESTNN